MPRGEQRGVLGTDFYHGGAVRMDIGGLHPAKFHAGLLRLALAAGAAVHGETAVQGIRSERDGHEVATARGTIRARDVIVGANGYADASDRWLRRRLVPVRSRIIATAPLSANLMGELMPRRMMCSETRSCTTTTVPRPDGERILFGGRDGTIAGDPDWPTENLRRALVDIFPVLDGAEITHSWYGHVAMNRDMVPRIFSRRGHALRRGLLRIGRGVGALGRAEGGKADPRRGNAAARRWISVRRRAVPLFAGKAWFMPAVFAWMTLQDRLARRKSSRAS